MIKHISRSIAYSSCILGLTLLGDSVISSPAMAQTSQTTTEQAQATAPAPTPTPDSTKSSKTFGDWIVNCITTTPEGGAEKQICEMSQTLKQNQTGQRIMTMNVRVVENGIALVYVMPFGLDMTKGITVKADDTLLFEQGFKTCFPSGCIVRVEASDENISTLSSAKKLTVTMFDLSDKAVDVDLSTNGFNDALENLKEQ